MKTLSHSIAGAVVAGAILLGAAGCATTGSVPSGAGEQAGAVPAQEGTAAVQQEQAAASAGSVHSAGSGTAADSGRQAGSASSASSGKAADSASTAHSGNSGGQGGTAGAPTVTETAVGLANPFREVRTLQEAATVAGFELNAPQAIAPAFSAQAIRAVQNDLIEVRYASAADGTVLVRKVFGNLDASGVYTRYPVTRTVNSNGTLIMLRGEEGLYHVATWVSGDYSFAVVAESGLTQQQVEALARSVL